MDADQNGEYDAAQEAVEKEADKLAEESSVSLEVGGGRSVDPHNDENPKSDPSEEALDPDDGTVNDAANDHRLSTERPRKDIPKEVPIEYLKNPLNGRVFAVNEDLLKRKDLIPCDEDGKKVYDNRKIGRFN